MPPIDREAPDKILASDLPAGKRVRTYFLCSKKDTPTTQKGTTYLRVTLRDASGELTGINWEPDTLLLSAFDQGDVVEVEGKFKVHEKFGPQLYLDAARRLDEADYDAATLVAVSPVTTGDLESRLQALLAAVGDDGLRSLLARALDQSHEPGVTFAVVPAAIRNHHAYRHGLLEHSVIVAETAHGVADAFDSVDADLVIAGALLHDIGKTRAYSSDPMATGLTDEGYLLGEIVAGLEIVTGLIAEIPRLAPEKARLLQHIIASHHGEREKGSPVVPQTREAVIVHFCDDMTARIAAIDEAAGQLAGDTTWTPQRVGMLGVSAYLGGGSFTEPPRLPLTAASGSSVDVAAPDTFAPDTGADDIDASGIDASAFDDSDIPFGESGDPDPQPDLSREPGPDLGADPGIDRRPDDAPPDDASGTAGEDPEAEPPAGSPDDAGEGEVRLFE